MSTKSKAPKAAAAPTKSQSPTSRKPPSKAVKGAPARKAVQQAESSTPRGAPARAKTAAAKPATKRAAPLVPPVTAAAPASAVTPSKQSQLIELLRSPSGGTIEQMINLTGWQPHTVRGTISGVLRKRLGLNVQCAVGADLATRVYRIVESVAA